VPALGRAFDYLVPDGMDGRVGVGSLVRITLQGRRVGGWVVGLDSTPPPGTALQPLAKVTGWGPPPDLVDLAEWAAHRWAGRPVAFLRTASPSRAVTGVPEPWTPSQPVPTTDDDRAESAFTVSDAWASTVVRLAPAADRFPLVLAACRRGNALVILPSVAEAEGLGVRLRRARVPVAVMPDEWAQARGGATVVGARSAAWAPVVDLAAVLVLDEHDEAHKQEQTPGWHARDVVVERARRAGVPCVLASPCPSLEALETGRLVTQPRSVERVGWPIVDVIDRRQDEPGRTGLYSPRLVELLRGGGRVLCVLNRKGRARLLACAACGEMAGCERCGAALGQAEPGTLTCLRCDLSRPTVCAACGGTRMKLLRVGVTRAAEELAALARTEVAEVTGDSVPGSLSEARIYVGTEAVLHQVSHADVVAFLDLDQELLAPRYRAAEEALALLARASRILGGRRRDGRLVLQTRLPEHEVVQAALHADPSRVSAAERERRRILGYPPSTAMAAVSGVVADEYVLGVEGVDLLGPRDGTWLLRAPDHATLLAALEQAPRPAGRLRLDVDPLRV
jgi:primosomal protein N' (replication factor Y) (superfamily II helicase)